MITHDAHAALGYGASLLVLVTFCMREMVPLRLVALASNAAFIAYGALADVGPVLLLHLVLLPTNVWRLAEVMHERRRRPCPTQAGSGHAGSTASPVRGNVIRRRGHGPRGARPAKIGKVRRLRKGRVEQAAFAVLKMPGHSPPAHSRQW
jgi:hypothetical protein